ncbi:hypothetical protein ACFB49_23050 [Sphingomonas sp. DBB INV C78]
MAWASEVWTATGRTQGGQGRIDWAIGIEAPPAIEPETRSGAVLRCGESGRPGEEPARRRCTGGKAGKGEGVSMVR